MKNKFKIIITSIIVLLPILVGVAYWDELPEQMTIAEYTEQVAQEEAAQEAQAQSEEVSAQAEGETDNN